MLAAVNPAISAITDGKYNSVRQLIGKPAEPAIDPDNFDFTTYPSVRTGSAHPLRTTTIGSYRQPRSTTPAFKLPIYNFLLQELPAEVPNAKRVAYIKRCYEQRIDPMRSMASF